MTSVRRRSELRDRRERAVHRRHAAQTVVGFRVEGTVDGVRTVACLVDGRLDCSPAVAARAQVVVALGEAFAGLEGSPVPASLDGSATSVLLTVMRAFSTIDSVEIVAGAPARAVGPDG